MELIEKPALLRTTPGVPSAYDVLGYLVPGGTLLFFMFAFEVLARHLIIGHSKYEAVFVHTPLRGFTLALLQDYGGAGWIVEVTILAVIFGLAYVIGHVLATLSSLFVDRLFVAKGYGYPFELFLFPKRAGRSYSGLSRSHYRGVVFWLPISLLLPLAASSLYRVGVLPSWAPVAALFPAALLVFETSLKAWLSAPPVSRSVHEMGYEGYRMSAWWRRASCYLIEIIFPWIYDRFAKLLAGWISSREPFSQELREKHQRCMEEQFDLHPSEGDTDHWWFPYIHVRTNSKVMASAVDNWLCMYAFARNLAAAFFFASLYGLMWLHMYRRVMHEWMRADVGWLLALVALCALLAVTMLFRYYYIYAHYYSRFVLRSFVYLCQRASASRDD